MASKSKIAIVGAGITGVHLASRLADVAEVTLFEKGRGIGGRMSTRRSGNYQFDHGAQYFTAHGQAFRDALAPFIKRGIVAEWRPRLASFGRNVPALQWNAPRYVAVPGMNALCKAMAEGLHVALQTRIAKLDPSADGRWKLISETGLPCGPFDWVLCTAPAEQTVALLPASFKDAEPLKNARMVGCYSLMLGGLDLSALTWDAASVADSPLAWMAVNNTKPERSDGASLLCQSSNTWAQDHIEDDAASVQEALVRAIHETTGLDADRAEYINLHKWRFAKVDVPSGKPYLMDEDKRLAAAGDWCGGGRVEAGFDSADKLAKSMMDKL